MIATCASCGAPATSTFNDGSPRWGPEHPSHPPIRGDGPTPWDALKITLDPAEQKRVEKVAKTVAERYRTGKTATMKYIPPGRSIDSVVVQGLGAELAVARWAGLEWNRGIRRKPDVGDDVEVRCVRRPDGMLALYSYDKAGRRFVFTVGSFPSYRLMGWIRGAEGMIYENWHPKGAVVMGYTLDVDRYLVSLDKLRPMGEFTRAVSEAPEATATPS